MTRACRRARVEAASRDEAMSAAGALVCGFSDVASQVAGVAWSIAGQSGALLSRSGETGASAVDLERTDEGARFSAELGAARWEVELRARTSVELGGGAAAALCEASASISGPGGDEQVHAEGHLTSWSSDPAEDAALIRHLTVPAAGGGLILLWAHRPVGSTDHAAERTSAWLLERDGATPFIEALLSTQYGPDGLPSRVGLELWREDADSPAMRAAGAHPARELGSGSNGTSAALLHTSADGTTGIGDYLIVRPNG